MKSLRSLFVPIAIATTAYAHSYVYTMNGTMQDVVLDIGFTLATPTAITERVVVPVSAFSQLRITFDPSARNWQDRNMRISSVEFAPNSYLSSNRLNDVVNFHIASDLDNGYTGHGEITYFFAPGSFAMEGLHTGTMNSEGTLGVSAVPEPASMIALSLGVATILRRRRKP